MADWIVTVVDTLGYVGIAALMFLENIFPPIPSEVIMPMAGFAVTRGDATLFNVILAGTVGSILGAFPWYYAGKILGKGRLQHLADKYGVWLTLSGADVEKAQHWFFKHGPKAVFIGRLIPGIRTFISIPAGISEMHMVPFLIYSTLGTVIWTGVLAYVGYLLGQNYEAVKGFLGPISTLVMGGLVLTSILWVIRRKRSLR